jgi:transposase
VLLLANGHNCVCVAEKVGLSPRHVSKWGRRFVRQGVDGLQDRPRPGRKPKFSPDVALHLVKMACEMPDLRGRSLSQWDCAEMARQLEAEKTVESISPQSVWRILTDHRLKPWRHHLWLSPKVPRDAAFAAAVRNLSDLYSRPLAPHEAVLCADEKTSLQPRTRKAKTLPSEPGKAVRVESEYDRKGALNLFAAFDTEPARCITAPRSANGNLTSFPCWKSWTANSTPQSRPFTSCSTICGCTKADSSKPGWLHIHGSISTIHRCTASG